MRSFLEQPSLNLVNYQNNVFQSVKSVDSVYIHDSKRIWALDSAKTAQKCCGVAGVTGGPVFCSVYFLLLQLTKKKHSQKKNSPLRGEKRPEKFSPLRGDFNQKMIKNQFLH